MAGPQVAIIDCGGANIASLQIALQRLDAKSELTNDRQTIASASHVILPGVGAAADAMQRLENDKLVDTIGNLRQPVLGICLGMQLLATTSDEDRTPCLNIIPADVVQLQAKPGLPVPNMGWCRVTDAQQNALFSEIDTGSYFYFVHSYAITASRYAIATAQHDRPFAAAVQRENFYGAQFHPERSAKTGAQFLRNFLDISK